MMFPRHLVLTCHGLGLPANASVMSDRSYWLTAEEFKGVLAAADAIEATTDIQVRFTFDDGNVSDHLVALPLLLDGRRTATFFVCANRIDAAGYLTAGQLREMAAAGMTIGSHGCNHVNWRTLSDAALAYEIVEGRRRIEVAIDRKVTLVSAPFGELDQRVVKAVKNAGFEALFTSAGGFASAVRGLVPRNTLKAGLNPEADLARLTTRQRRAWSGLYDAARRRKYGFY
jgi:peptidoglycan/xylan/chitin deacetylase (PgdA/CDA1 family)